MGLNRIVLLGTVAQEPEKRYNASGQPDTRFILAVEQAQGSEGKAETNYIRVVARRGLAERCAETLKRGDLATVEGRLYTSTYETRDGHHRKAVEVEALQVEVVTPAGSGHARSTLPLHAPPPGPIPPPAVPHPAAWTGDAPH